jgi:hypothetical protein
MKSRIVQGLTQKKCIRTEVPVLSSGRFNKPVAMH